jgi:hypothetical protein
MGCSWCSNPKGLLAAPSTLANSAEVQKVQFALVAPIAPEVLQFKL